MSLLASTIDVMLSRANITTVDAFAELLLSAPTFIANFIRSEAAAAAAAGRHAAEIGTMTDASVVDMGTQATSFMARLCGAREISSPGCRGPDRPCPGRTGGGREIGSC